MATLTKKSMKLGGGGRFATLSSKIQQKEGLSKKAADAIAATVGRKKYGAKKFAQLSRKGK